jgi:hypothetical protein
MTIPGAERVEAGQTVRDYVSAGAKPDGVDVFYGGGKQRRNVDGTWEDRTDPLWKTKVKPPAQP